MTSADPAPELKPLPTARIPLEIEALIEPDAFELIRSGYESTSPGDRWIIRLEEDLWLRMYRRTTGSCIYAARLAPDGENYTIPEAWANRDPAQYRGSDPVYDARLFVYLIRRLLLKHDVPFPHPADLPHQNKVIHEKHVMGGDDDQKSSYIPLDLAD